MSNAFKLISSFIAGAVAGSIITAIIVKKHEREKFDEEADGIVEGLKDNFLKMLKKRDEAKQGDISEPDATTKDTAESNTPAAPVNRRKQYADLMNQYRAENDQPYLIDEEDYDNGHYTMSLLYMFADGVITHEDKKFPLDILEKDRLLGDTLERLDDTGYDDRFYVSCPEKETNYEVVILDKDYYE